MVKAPTDLKPAAMLRDAVHIWNEKELEWFPAWEHRFNKRKKVDFFRLTNASSTGPVYSDSFYCAPYRNALVLWDFRDTIGAPTRILFLAWFSWDEVIWYQFMEDAWGRMQWEDTDLPSLEAYPIEITAPYIRFSYGVTDGSEQAYFPFTLKVIFNSV